MKPIPLLAASALILALVLSPMTFAAGSITFSSPSSGASYKGTQSYSIAGTVSPAPGVIDNVFITVKNPSGVTVDAASVPATPSSGAFSYATATGGSSNWVTGTYTISATDSYGASGTTTFAYTAQGTTVSGLTFQAQGSSLVTAGETAYISALVIQNGAPVSGANFTGSWYWAPGASSATTLGSPTAGPAGAYEWSLPITATSHPGLYAVFLSLTLSGSRTWVQTGFTVTTLANSNSGNLQKDLAGNFSAISTSLSGITSSLSGVTSSLSGVTSSLSGITSSLSGLTSTANSINGAVGGLGTTLSNIQTTLGNVNTAVQNLSGLSNQLSSATSGINTTQTYVLVVAALAAITLVLELAILVRKLS